MGAGTAARRCVAVVAVWGGKGVASTVNVAQAWRKCVCAAAHEEPVQNVPNPFGRWSVLGIAVNWRADNPPTVNTTGPNRTSRQRAAHGVGAAGRQGGGSGGSSAAGCSGR